LLKNQSNEIKSCNTWFSKNVVEKNGTVNTFLQRKLYQRKKAKRSSEVFKANQLLNKAIFLKFGLKKANLATLVCAAY